MPIIMGRQTNKGSCGVESIFGQTIGEMIIRIVATIGWFNVEDGFFS